jgi:RNA-binding protein NOB1
MDTTKVFCPKCGNDSLVKVAATVDQDGKLQVHVDERKLVRKRGQQKQSKEIQGGKHDQPTKFFEDQRMPHNRAAKRADDALDDAPFAKHDVMSRSAILGIRSKRAPNRRRR